jgi:hypothetical protein
MAVTKKRYGEIPDTPPTKLWGFDSTRGDNRSQIVPRTPGSNQRICSPHSVAFWLVYEIIKSATLFAA